MKKRNLKNLHLNKTSISNLRGGLDIGTIPTITVPNSNQIGCWSDDIHSCPSEYRTACEPIVNETCHIECESIHVPSEVHINTL